MVAEKRSDGCSKFFSYEVSSHLLKKLMYSGGESVHWVGGCLKRTFRVGLCCFKNTAMDVAPDTRCSSPGLTFPLLREEVYESAEGRIFLSP